MPPHQRHSAAAETRPAIPPKMRRRINASKHDTEKWKPVFGKDHAQTKS
jgi:hypothetical protein